MENIKPRGAKNIYRRTWLMPYMGDASFAAAATLRHFNIDSRVLPTDTERGHELAQRHISSEICYPLKGVTADVLDFLERKKAVRGAGFVNDNYFVVMPTTCGPCRMGKYQEALRYFMDGGGFENVPLGGPSTVTNYSDILPEDSSKKDKLKLQKMFLKGLATIDLLDDITLRTRPYADDKGRVTQLKKERLNRLEQLIEKGADIGGLVDWGRETVSQFGKHISGKKRFPLVVYAGELYMRQHDAYTGNVVEKLENQGLEVVRTPTMEWFEYVNEINIIDSRSRAWSGVRHFRFGDAAENMKKLAQQTIKGKYLHHIEKRLALPFHDILEGRHTLPRPLEMIETLEENGEFDRQIRGESSLSIGIAYYLMNDLIPKTEHQIAGMFHVGPFTCMQEGVATAKIEAMAKRLRESNPDLLFPVVHGAFGDSPNPNLDSEIAVFRQQCYQKRALQK